MNYKRLIISLALPQIAGLIGSVFTAPSIPLWYEGLVKPAFNPPNWIFGPVWITLYILMGISVFLVWQKTDFSIFTKGLCCLIPGKLKKECKASLCARESVFLFWVHLIINALWSVIFFGLKNPFMGFITIIVLWLFIILLIIRFWKVSKVAACLLVPYFLWVSFAGVLNFFLWYLNK